MKKSRFVNVLFWIFCLGYTCQLSSQESNPIETAVPFLLIVPDAASAGIGELGVASREDAFSNFHNPAKCTRQQEFALHHCFAAEAAAGVWQFCRGNERLC